ncbi:protein ECERIFERUM 26-like [Primulina eburnea]|uniref:protein ECERIFERUM 26-like n=1 Tax=Primulina eburnea TaxID=1245227 RepID=UPI003C6C25F6
MVSSAMEEGLIYNIKLSSIGPGNVTVPDSIYEPENMDLAMKLHYLRCIYYFGNKAFEGLTPLVIKEPMFVWLNEFPVTSGRFRRTEAGRPYIKCNDSGVRFIEASCDKTLEEWLETKDDAHEKALVSSQIIGPELSFSPLVFIQLTKFKCGGTAVGLSWAHALGDAFSAARFMNQLGKTMDGNGPGRPIALAQSLTKSTSANIQPGDVEDPLSIKRVGPVGENWMKVTECNMNTFSFNIPGTQLSHLQSKLRREGAEFSPFEALSAVLWQCIAKIRGRGPKVVTICEKGKKNETDGTLGNGLNVSVVKAEFPIEEATPSELATLLKTRALDERKKIDQIMEKEQGLSDFIVYGANLTFVNLDEGNFYEFEYRGQKPVSFSLKIDGVGEEGAILVLPGDKNVCEGRKVTAILPENEITELKDELKREGLLA